MEPGSRIWLNPSIPDLLRIPLVMHTNLTPSPLSKDLSFLDCTENKLDQHTQTTAAKYLPPVPCVPTESPPCLNANKMKLESLFITPVAEQSTGWECTP